VRLPQMAAIAIEEVPYGYCTEFLLKGEELNPDKIKARLQKKGQSLIVVGDETTARVHIHTLDPGNVIRYATSLGTMHQVSIRNMDEQHQDFLEMQIRAFLFHICYKFSSFTLRSYIKCFG